MPQYAAPGVYVEEVPSAIKPIAGVGTSTAAFVGIVVDLTDTVMPEKPTSTRDKPVHYVQVSVLAPQPINSWDEFRQKFGDFDSIRARLAALPSPAPGSSTGGSSGGSGTNGSSGDSGTGGSDTGGSGTNGSGSAAVTVADNQYLAHAVYGFFNNGGTRCWVTRITSLDDFGKAVDKLESIDEIAIVAAPLPPETSPEALNAAQAKLVSHCQLMEDRVAILDSSRDITGDNLEISSDDSGIWRPAANPKGYGAFYFPWIEVADPLQKAGTRIAVPPSGHLAGIYARSDAQRGVHKAPANEVVLGALGVRYPVSKILQGALNPRGVNCIRSFNGTIKVWGARSLASDEAGDPEWIYVNVRRLFNFLRESIDQGTQWVVFEPNTPQLWAKIRRNITAFLTTVWNAGALFGNTPEEAFYVRCDETTNPPEVRELGQVVTEIGVAVVRPAEFVIFRVSQWAGPGAEG